MAGWAVSLVVGVVLLVEAGTLEDTFPRTPIINTRKGKVQGRTITLVGGVYELDPVDVYLGIPYALPPTGIWRFSPTQDLPPWPGVLQATTQGPACTQTYPSMENKTEALGRYTAGYLQYLHNVRSSTLSMSEDCLYLNIFTPSNKGPTNNTENNKGRGVGVMVFIPGDSYSWGSASLYDARVLATLGKIIVVTFNYRIGILGYLNPNPNPDHRGSVSNYGLVDQMAALQWVSENIQAFGGNPEQVTLVGQGRGAASVEYLVHSPMIRQSHFQRVVLMSGSIFSSWSRVHNPSQVAVRVARQLGCPIPADLQTHHANILHCLRTKSLEELMTVDVGEELSFLTNLGPSIDGVTIKKNFVDIRGKRSFETRSYDCIVGVTERDWIHELGEQGVSQGLLPGQREEILRTLVLNNYEGHHREIFLAVNNEYSDFNQESVDTMRLRNLTLEALSDALFSAPAVHSAATFFRRKNNTFFYNWAYATRNGMYPEGVGGSYGQELDYLFGIPICNLWPHQAYKYTRGEAVLSAMFITYLTNFVKTGNPNVPMAMEQLIKSHNDAKRNKIIAWEPFFENKRNYLEIDLRPEMKENYKAHQMSLWLRLIPQLEMTGLSSLFGHSQLTGDTWGLARNLTSVPGVQQSTVGDLVVGAEGIQINQYNQMLMVGILFGSSLLLANALILVCICYNRKNRRSRWERETRGVGSTECLNNSIIETQCVPTFSTPGRTATLHRHTLSPTDRSAVPLVNYDAVGGGGGKYTEYRVCSTVPLVTDIPAPSQFNDTTLQDIHYRQEAITC